MAKPKGPKPPPKDEDKKRAAKLARKRSAKLKAKRTA